MFFLDRHQKGYVMQFSSLCSKLKRQSKMKEKRVKKTLPQYYDLKEPPSNIKSFYLSKNLTNKDFRMKFFFCMISDGLKSTSFLYVPLIFTTTKVLIMKYLNLKFCKKNVFWENFFFVFEKKRKKFQAHCKTRRWNFHSCLL